MDSTGRKILPSHGRGHWFEPSTAHQIDSSQQNELQSLKLAIANEEKTTGLINLTIKL